MFIHPLSQGPIKCPMTHIFQQHSLGYQTLQAPFSCTRPDPKLSLTYYDASLQNWELMQGFNTSLWTTQIPFGAESSEESQ